MNRMCRSAKINVKVLVILLAVVVVLVGGAFAARHIRRRILSARDLSAGRAAFDKQDWSAACKYIREYLGRNPNDVEMLKMYAEANLSLCWEETEKRDTSTSIKNIMTAIGAYRRVMQLDPSDEKVYEKLAKLYRYTGNYSELEYIASKRLENNPNDLKAPVWQAEALFVLKKREKAYGILLKYINRLDSMKEKHPEYIEACGILSEIAAKSGTVNAQANALAWLDRAVKYDPKSIKALLYRSRFKRMQLVAPGMTREERERKLAAAVADLRRADEIGTFNPHLRLALAAEWMYHGRLDKAADELEHLKGLDKATLSDYYLDRADWILQKFLISAELSLRKKDIEKGVKIVNEALAKLEKGRQRPRILPLAIRLYVVAGNTADARRCLDEYSTALRTGKITPRFAHEADFLRAFIAKREKKYYTIINILEPIVAKGTSRPELLALLAEAYSQTNQPRRAKWVLERYLQLRPHQVSMIFQLAREYFKLRDWKRAYKMASLAESLSPRDIDITFLRIKAGVYLAIEQQNENNKAMLDKLSKQLASLQKLYPDRVDIRVLRSIISDSQGRHDEAQKELSLAIKECNDTLPAEMQLVQHYYRIKQVAEAVRLCSIACERHSTVAEPWLMLSDLYAAQSHFDDALNCLRIAMDKVVGQHEKRNIVIRLAQMELLYGNRQTGIDLLEELAKKDKRDIRVRSLLLSIREVQSKQPLAQKLVDEIRSVEGDAGLLWRLRQASLWLSSEDWYSKQDQIVKMLERCIGSDPEWSEPVILLVKMYMRMGRIDRAEEVCRQCIARNPSARDVAIQLVLILEKQKRFSEAQEVLNKVRMASRAAGSWQVRLALKAGDFSSAIDKLKIRASSDRQDVSSRIMLARLIYERTKDANKAFKYLDQAEQIDPESVAVVATRVLILTAEGRSKDARKILDDRVSKYNNFVDYMLRASYLASIGEIKLAERDYIKMMEFPGEKGARGCELLARLYARNDRLDKAIETLEKGISDHPNDISLKRSLMIALFTRRKSGDKLRAEGILTSLIRRFPNNPELMRIQATELLRDNRWQSTEKARKILERVVRLEPTSVAAYLSLINIAMRKGHYKEARDIAVRAMSTNPENAYLMLARANAELALHNEQMAIDLARMAINEHPYNTDAYNMLIALATKKKDEKLLENIHTRIESAVKTRPEDENLQVARAMLLHAMGHTKEAISNLETYCSKDSSEHIRAILALANLYRLDGNMTKAKEKIELADKLAPENINVIRARFMLLSAQKNFAELIKQISRRIDQQEQIGAIVYGIKILSDSESIQNKKEAIKLYQSLLKVNPDLIVARLQLAFLARQIGLIDLAKENYEKVLEKYPDNVIALNDLAWILFEHYKEYEKALELANRGLKLEPDNLYLLDTRGTILANMPDRLADARKDFEKQLALTTLNSPRRARALLQMGRICAKCKEVAQAKQYLKQASQIDRAYNLFTQKEREEIQRILHD